jgi:isoleucyl-tRNA synthetase
VHHFAAVTLSSFYFDILKDRLYTFPASSPARRSAQSALWLLADGLCRLMAPILCFTAEEIWQRLEALRGNESWTTRSVHATHFPEPLVERPDRELLDRWERLGQIREEVNKALELARAAKAIGTSLEAYVTIDTSDADTANFLRSFGDGLHFLFITSEARLGNVSAGAFRSETIEGLAVDVRRAPGDKCERCWHYTEDVGEDETWPTICKRCAGNVRAIVEQEQA